MKNFFDIKGEKISEKAFSQSLIISVISILLCLVALCSTTYAWFIGSTSSSNNVLESGCFDLIISVAPPTDGTATASDTDMVVDASGIYTLKAVGTYTVNLEPTPQTTVKGYCVITVGNTEYQTPVIVKESTTSEEYPTSNVPFVFKIETIEENTEVKFEIRWGVPVTSTLSRDEVIKAGTANAATEETGSTE